jgi:hypothetical protein
MKTTTYRIASLADDLAEDWRVVSSANPPPPYKVADDWREGVADEKTKPLPVCITMM